MQIFAVRHATANYEHAKTKLRPVKCLCKTVWKEINVELRLTPLLASLIACQTVKEVIDIKTIILTNDFTIQIANALKNNWRYTKFGQVNLATEPLNMMKYRISISKTHNRFANLNGRHIEATHNINLVQLSSF